MSVYYERQQGDNCRIHAINNCFGGPFITRAEFDAYGKEFEPQGEITPVDSYVTARSWDRTHLLAHVLRKKFQLHCFTIGHYELSRFKAAKVVRSVMDAMDLELARFFVCDSGHVWCVKRVGDTWYCLDSMKGGPCRTTPEQWERDDLTLIFPWTDKRCVQGVYEMQKLVRWYFRGMTETELRTSMIQDLSKREPDHFGDCQNWIALFYKFLGVYSSRYTNVVEKYKDYDSASKLDVMHTLKYLPELILFIVRFK